MLFLILLGANTTAICRDSHVRHCSRVRLDRDSMERITSELKAARSAVRPKDCLGLDLFLRLVACALGRHTAAAVGKCGQAVENLVGG